MLFSTFFNLSHLPLALLLLEPGGAWLGSDDISLVVVSGWSRFSLGSLDRGRGHLRIVSFAFLSTCLRGRFRCRRRLKSRLFRGKTKGVSRRVKLSRQFLHLIFPVKKFSLIVMKVFLNHYSTLSDSPFLLLWFSCNQHKYVLMFQQVPRQKLKFCFLLNPVKRIWITN